MVPVQDGKRLGRGKGYYDSYLKQIKDKGLTTKTIGELSYMRTYVYSQCVQHAVELHMLAPTVGSLCLLLVN